MKLSDRDSSAWRKFGFALTAITVVLTGGLVIASSELAMEPSAAFNGMVRER